MKKRFGIYFSVLAALLLFLVFPIKVNAEEGKSYDEAIILSLDGTVTPTYDGSKRIFTFTVPTATMLDLVFIENGQAEFWVKDQLQRDIYYRDTYSSRDFSFAVSQGTYYIEVGSYWGLSSFSLSATAESISEDIPEPQGGNNNTIAKATVIQPGKDFDAALGLDDRNDYYEFTVDSAQTVSLDLTSYVNQDIGIIFYQKNGEKIGETSLRTANGVGHTVYKQDLPSAGTYCLMFYSINFWGDYYGGWGGYTFSLSTTQGRKFGFANINGGKFFEINGEVATTVNGLTQDPDNTSDWYFCAAGRVVAQKTGLVMYNGSTFYVENGKLNTGVNGFFDFNGGLFFVSKGRVIKTATGLVQDPNKRTDWYFCANGQVQKKKTGVVIYNKAGFYVVNGKLDTSYNGNATYNGKTVKIVNGRMK